MSDSAEFMHWRLYIIAILLFIGVHAGSPVPSGYLHIEPGFETYNTCFSSADVGSNYP
jgi:hypothetical protein